MEPLMVQDRAKVPQEQDISRLTGCGNTSVCRLVENFAQRGYNGAAGCCGTAGVWHERDSLLAPYHLHCDWLTPYRNSL